MDFKLKIVVEELRVKSHWSGVNGQESMVGVIIFGLLRSDSRFTIHEISQESMVRSKKASGLSGSHSLLITHYSLLITHYSLLIGSNSPLTTHYFPLKFRHQFKIQSPIR